MKIAVIGSGAMGSLFAARLSESATICMIGGWQEQIGTINKSGILLTHPDGAESRHSFMATTSVDEVGKVEIALVLVKAWQSGAAARVAEKTLAREGLAITLQNGLGNLETIAAAVGSARAVLGVTSEGATMIRPGAVRHAGAGQTFLAVNERTHSRLTGLLALFRAAGFQSDLVDDPTALVWAKLAVNAGINPLTALLRVQNGFLLDHQVSKELMGRAANEVSDVANAQGIDVPYTRASDRAIEVAQATATNWSSMAQDMARGAPTEIDFICGAIVQHGEEWGVATPVNRALLYLVKRQIEFGDWRDQIGQLPSDLQPPFLHLASLGGQK